jgi:Flp pilus assembly protein TadD
MSAFVAVVALSFAVGALTIISFHYTSFRYELDFLPVLMSLTVLGILGGERALAGSPFWRRVGRWGWAGLLVISVAIVGLMSCAQAARTESEVGRLLAELGRLPESVSHFKQGLRFEPDSIDGHNNLGIALLRLGQVPEAAAEFATAVQLQPDDAEAHNNLGIALFRLGKLREGGTEFVTAIQLKPEFAEAHNNLGMALLKLGKVPEAKAEIATAVQLQPDNAEAQEQLARLRAAQPIK